MLQDFFDMKRSLATATNTTFVYDFPDMFKVINYDNYLIMQYRIIIHYVC